MYMYACTYVRTKVSLYNEVIYGWGFGKNMADEV